MMTDRMRALLSFHYFGRTDIGDCAQAMSVNGNPPDLFADSGAYSAHTQGVTLTVDGYAEWLHRWREHFTVYASLDVMNNARQSLDNLKALESLGLAPLPVVHVRSDLQHLRDTVSEYPYVAIGGMVGTHLNVMMPWLVQAFKIARDAGAVLHGFGMTSLGALMSFPWYSVDSSSWGSGYRYGRVQVFDARTKRLVGIDLGDAPGWGRNGAAVRALGFDPLDFADRARNTRMHNVAIAAVSMFRYECYLRQRHGVIKLPDFDRPEVKRPPVGPAVYLAVSGGGRGNAGDGIDAATGLRLYLADGSTTNLFDAATSLDRM